MLDHSTTPQSEDAWCCATEATCELDRAMQAVEAEFAGVEEWEERYQILVELGDTLEPLPDEWKNEEHRIHGCLSTVWMVFSWSEDDPPRLHVLADSDSPMVRGLLAIVLRIYNGRPPQEVLSCDIRCLFQRLQLEKHLSYNRRNGLTAMIRRIQDAARQKRQTLARQPATASNAAGTAGA
ncbi:MAG: SufE family protein [Thermogutta sp.]|nr:SufE family protein [Thermogutta sp.]